MIPYKLQRNNTNIFHNDKQVLKIYRYGIFRTDYIEDGGGVISSYDYEVLPYIIATENKKCYLDSLVNLYDYYNAEWEIGANISLETNITGKYYNNEMVLFNDRIKINSEQNIISFLCYTKSTAYLTIKTAYMSSYAAITRLTLEDNEIINYKFTNKSVYFNDRQIDFNKPKPNENILNSNTTVKFGYDDTNNRGFFGKIYNIYIKVNNLYVRSYYPCRRLSDRICGLYDIITDKFYRGVKNDYTYY